MKTTRASTPPDEDIIRPTAPTQEEIAARAYSLWETNGRQDGNDLSYWLSAERELREQREGARGPDAEPGTLASHPFQAQST